MRKVCNKCGKKVPKKYVDAHNKYHTRKETEGKKNR